MKRPWKKQRRRDRRIKQAICRELLQAPLVEKPDYQKACRLAENGDYESAREAFTKLKQKTKEPAGQAILVNDLAVLDALSGCTHAAARGFRAALNLEEFCEPARANLSLLEGTQLPREDEGEGGEGEEVREGTRNLPPPSEAIKVAVVSFLFNWPSTGGGIVHTIELVEQLEKVGFEVKHFYVRYTPWEIGRVEKPLSFSSEVLEFDQTTWNLAEIKSRFRKAVGDFEPDHVILTDSWNMKPVLADALKDYPYILRFQALECFCPLNNLRLLPSIGGGFEQCPLSQFTHPDICRVCVQLWGAHSGSLHQAERQLAGVGTREYEEMLQRVLREAEAAFVVNPPSAELIAPFVKEVARRSGRYGRREIPVAVAKGTNGPSR